MKIQKTELGSALVYILIAIALLAALTVSFMGSDTQQSRSQNAFRTATNIENQIQFIRSVIQECVLTYPQGDASVDDTPGTGTDEGYYNPYPVNPSSGHFTGSTLGAETNDNVEHIRCPGNPGGDQNNHEPLFGGSTGRFLPPAPDLFEDWIYFNGVQTDGSTTFDGVYLTLRSDKSDPFIGEALDRVDTKFATCEAASVTDASDGCPTGYRCLRYWIVGEEPGC